MLILCKGYFVICSYIFLLLAVLSRRKDLVMWLLSLRNESVNTPNNDGKCPIHLAAISNNVEMVKVRIPDFSFTSMNHDENSIDYILLTFAKVRTAYDEHH